LSLVLFLALSAYAQSTYAQSATSAHVQTVLLKSKLVGATLPYNVIIPLSYHADGRRKSYPVLYLLHGLGGHYDNWISKTSLVTYAAQYSIIIVTPEGSDGWYTDSATVATDKYESYLLRELIPDVEHRFRAVSGRQGRSIAGLSMGGYGALKFAVKHPEKFVFAGSMSGALDPAVRSETHQGFAWGFVRPSILKVFGAVGNPVRAGNDLHLLFRGLPASRIKRLPHLYFDCGTEDGFLTTNRDLAAILRERNIPHEYREPPGKHEWAYWDQRVRVVLKLAAEQMATR
jgi:S-formylglutathione hydrolase FrmB